MLDVACCQNAEVESCFLDRRAECGQLTDSHVPAAGQVIGSCAKSSVPQVITSHSEHCAVKLREGELTFSDPVHHLSVYLVGLGR